MKKETDKRKLEHIEIVNSNKDVDCNDRYFDDVQLIHRALPEIDLADVNTSCSFLGKSLSFPLLISPMTGGSNNVIIQANKNLAIAAEQCGVALGVGSQRVLFEESKAKDSFQLRQYAPNTLLFANLGAIQLNYGFGIKECQEVINILDADALILHLNPLQETIQQSKNTEGNTNFSNLIEKIADIQSRLNVPVILKEVGSGFSTTDADLVLRHGLKYIDIAGQGGTSWSMVEHLRNKQSTENQVQSDLGLTFKSWGIPTPKCLEILSAHSEELTLIASGGLRNGIDMGKAIVLGASLCGIANPFLEPALQSPESVVKIIEQLRQEFSTTLFLLGCKTVPSVFKNRSLLLEP